MCIVWHMIMPMIPLLNMSIRHISECMIWKYCSFFSRVQIQSVVHQFMFSLETLYPQFIIAITFLVLKSSIAQSTKCSAFNFRSSVFRPTYFLSIFLFLLVIWGMFLHVKSNSLWSHWVQKVLIYSQDKVYKIKQSYHPGISSMDLLPFSVVNFSTFVRFQIKDFIKDFFRTLTQTSFRETLKLKNIERIISKDE